MTIQRGASGPVVQRIQQRLKDLQLYAGPIDSSFGGGSEAAIKNLQIRAKLPPTGIVDAATWNQLFPGEKPPEPELAAAPVAERCMALTGTFETGIQPPDCFCGIAGDFDGMGLSFGVLQWNIGQGTLQPLLQEMVTQHTDICKSIFHENLDTVTQLGGESMDAQLTFVRSVQTRGSMNEPWRGMLIALGRTPEFRAIQSAHAASLYQRALAACAAFELTSQRAAALMFDILTQNGGIGAIVKSQILADYSQIAATNPADLEVARMRAIANRVAAAARPQFVDDVRVRKLTIADGTGVVHGIPYDLAGVFCLGLDPFVQASSTTAGQ